VRANAFWCACDQFVVFDKFQGKFPCHILCWSLRWR
jgi:hypothetical protein